jgi:hypothetical protein
MAMCFLAAVGTVAAIASQRLIMQTQFTIREAK